MLSPSSLLSKIIGVLDRNGGGKMDPSSLSSAVCRSWTWHLSAFVSGWGHLISFLHFAFVRLDNPFWPLLCSLPCHHDLWSIDVKYCQIHYFVAICSREVDLCKVSTFLWFSFDPDSQKTSCSSVSCRWCGKHYGPPSIKVTSVDFSSLSRKLI